ncbi:hypothetical protein Poly59_14960 [Rubripirellula reticaptiva]|uniref:Uncharacterized protein n=1 Tax=Rubripirellula reticaptiva TaxID=2528013 RepID=A0A5C6F5S6_9BACT|nr:hypothetical protein Poly59_14960 [Rubripirellula reticaptiva]
MATVKLEAIRKTFPTRNSGKDKTAQTLRRSASAWDHWYLPKSDEFNSPSLGVAEELATTRGGASGKMGSIRSSRIPSPKPRASASTLPKEGEEHLRRYQCPLGESSRSEERVSAIASPTRPLLRPTSPLGGKNGRIPKPENLAVSRSTGISIYDHHLHSPFGHWYLPKSDEFNSPSLGRVAEELATTRGGASGEMAVIVRRESPPRNLVPRLRPSPRRVKKTYVDTNPLWQSRAEARRGKIQITSTCNTDSDSPKGTAIITSLRGGRTR